MPHLIDDDSGVGTQVQARDVTGNGLPDMIVGNQKGVFLHRHTARPATAEEWEAAQPRPLAGRVATN